MLHCRAAWPDAGAMIASVPVLKFVAALAVALVIGTDAFGQVDQIGDLTGTVSDPTGRTLPGATVTVSGRGFARSAIADAEGRFEIPNLPHGSYAVTGELPGFQPQTLRNVVAEPGQTTNIILVLPLDCLATLDVVDMGTQWAIDQAESILQIRITESGAPARWSFAGYCVDGTEYRATILHVVKGAPVEGGSGAPVRFVLPRRSQRYEPGEEYVAMLRRDGAVEGYMPLGDFLMFPVRNGRVTWTRTDVSTLEDQMRIEDFISALEAAVKRAVAVER
jgi:hypothetical protein